ncbi:MAG TPA: sigma 54-interacting transcriptional regulator [Kofleriaceae bacterium]|nr:sigma 54-interacting transcriptional regulator [Kofleriaceae bacterium]
MSAGNPTDEGRQGIGQGKFPDFVPPTKIQYGPDRPPTLHLRRCTLSPVDGGEDLTFDKDEITLGAMEENDVVLRDDTVSRYHCKIVQEDTGYVLVDLRSTNGTFINKVRIREGYLKPGCTISVGQQQLKFNARDEPVEIIPSGADRCGDIIGRNARMREIYAIIEKISPTNTTVVIEGETGTGKEVVAQSIHQMSARARGPLIIFDCGAVPPNLIESELFGHEKGSFTGAVMTRQGLFELADGGTLFLDELGELPIDLQPKLLRALEQREVRRVGSSKSIKVDVRIIAATNRNLENEVREGRFRQDLFYRLSVVRLLLPALRERSDDIPLLIVHFLKNQKYNRGSDGQSRIKSVNPLALQALINYDWPGNVRELVNVVERAVSFSDSEIIQTEDLPEHVRDARARTPRPSVRSGHAPSYGHGGHGGHGARTPKPTLDPPRTPSELLTGDVTFKDAKERWVSSFERDYIISLLKRHGGNISHAAREADIDRKYFRKLMKKYDIEAAGAVEDG